MSWIQKHCDEEYVKDAEAKIWETVSCLHGLESQKLRSSDVLIWIVKMLKYHENATTEQSATPSASGLSAAQAPQYMSLAEQYGFRDEMEIGSTGTSDQTIEQEYQSYITAALSPKTIDILKF
jgi:hypothetical protein